MNELRVDIGHVVVDGLSGRAIDGPRLGQMTEAALQGLLERQGAPPGIANRDIGELAALQVNLPPGAGEAQIAQALGQAIYQAIVRRG